MKHLKVLICLLVTFAAVINCSNIEQEEKEAWKFVQELDTQLTIEGNKMSEANWNYESNITQPNEDRKMKVQKAFAEFAKNNAMKLMKFNCSGYKNETLKRMIKKLKNIGDSILDEPKFIELKEAILRMQSNYATAKVPSFADDKVMFSLEPEITNVFESSSDPDELKYYWTEWHNRAGKPSRKDFWKYVGLRNEAAWKSNFKDGSEVWLNEYEDPTFEKQIESLLDQLKPLYLQLHGFVRHKLFEFYGPEHVDLKKPIPIHLLGNIWGQKWIIPHIAIPFKRKQAVDVTDEMINQGMTPRKMFEMGEEFFVSLNMQKLPETFWKKSILEKPADGRKLICHASAWDFAIKHDVRIKQCTRVTMESFITAHHELGHVEYYLHYNHQPAVFRSGANPGFHEAIGDVMALSVGTSKHLQRIGLLKDFVPDEENELNRLVRLGLEKLAFLPFAFVMDKFRWEAFRGNIEPQDANCYFWKLREKYGGVEPAVVRTKRDFDITAKYHASADVEYLRYFVSFIVQFQFHKAACIKAGEYEENNPKKSLNDCDIYKSIKAGNDLKAMLSMGSSKPWPDAMEVMTGQRQMNASGILDYFKPLEDWLLKTNKKLGVNIGWIPSDSKKAFDNLNGDGDEDYI